MAKTCPRAAINFTNQLLAFNSFLELYSNTKQIIILWSPGDVVVVQEFGSIQT